MANVVVLLYSSCFTHVLLFACLAYTQNIVGKTLYLICFEIADGTFAKPT